MEDDDLEIIGQGQYYLRQRKDYSYYKVLRALISLVEQDVKSVINVGCGPIPLFKGLKKISKRVYLDLDAVPKELDGAVAIKEDFLKYETAEKFDLAVCSQVLERVPEVGKFIAKLKGLSRNLIISVPYKWQPDTKDNHAHDFIDGEKVRKWLGMSPQMEFIVKDHGCRLIACYGDIFKVKMPAIHVNDQSIPSFKRMPGELWAISCLFNPQGYKSKTENFKQFREKLAEQHVPLLMVELAFGDEPYVLTSKDAEILVQLRATRHQTMWQKEALLNIALKHLPKICDKVAWLDCDVIFMNRSWAVQTSLLLSMYKVVQPYAVAARLLKGGRDIRVGLLPFGNGDNQRSLGLNFALLANNEGTSNFNTAHTGFAMAARREIIAQLGGFYDKNILGGGDVIMGGALFKKIPCEYESRVSKRHLLEMCQWLIKAQKIIDQSVCYLPGHLLHLWHGSVLHRNYISRYRLLVENDFCPKNDIRKDRQGLWKWCSNKPLLHQGVTKYFHLRNEDYGPQEGCK